MSKRKTGLLIAFGAVMGAAAAGISYYLKYKSFNDELDKDFHDYEDEDSSSKEEKTDTASGTEPAERSYITINSAKSEADETADSTAAPQAQETPASSDEETAEAAPDACPSDAPAEAGAPAEEKKQTIPAATIEEDTDGVDA